MITINPHDKRVTVLDVIDLHYDQDAAQGTPKIQVRSRAAERVIRERVPQPLQSTAHGILNELADQASDTIASMVVRLAQKFLPK